MRGRLREILPSAKAVMLTAYEDDDDVFPLIGRRRVRLSGQAGRIGSFEEAIREAHRGGSPISAAWPGNWSNFFSSRRRTEKTGGGHAGVVAP
jgi:DNA-binding NarL/FixJ family response regulator